jgi:AraC-like DNA-binding protein
MRTRVVQLEQAGARWELATRVLPPALEPYVRNLMGYSERSAGRVLQRQFPGVQVVVILELAPPIQLRADVPGAPGRSYAGGFVAGVDEAPTLTEHGGYQRGLQLDFTPLGARLFFGLPMSELAGRVVHWRDVVPREYRELAARLAELPDWDARLGLVERLVLERLAAARLRTAPVAWACEQLQRSGGRLPVTGLARELGYSAKHLGTLFRDQVGLTPKRVARLVRFDQLAAHLRATPPGALEPWGQLALRFGYADQAHLGREVRQFTGLPPRQALGALARLDVDGAATE